MVERVQKRLVLRVQTIAQKVDDPDRRTRVHLEAYERVYAAILKDRSELVLSGKAVVIGEGGPFSSGRSDGMGHIGGGVVSIAE